MPTTPAFEIKPSGFPHIDALLSLPAFDDQNWEESFCSAMVESFNYHFNHSREFKGLVEQNGFTLSQKPSFKEVLNIPWMFVQSFKEFDLLSVDPSEIELTLTSSGTGGLKTKTFLDQTTLNRVSGCAFNVYDALGILKSQTGYANYLLFTYDVTQAPHLGTAWTDVLISNMLTPRGRSFFIRKKTAQSDFEFDLEMALSKYCEFAKSGDPVRFLGFPAFIYHTLLEAKKRGLPKVAYASESWVLTGGGWKNHTGEIISKKDFALFVEEVCGIPKQNVRDLFGMTEHGVGYVDCFEGRLHVPVYAHAVTRDPFTLEILPYGKSGILHLYSPILKSYPSLSLLTTDEVIISDAPCSCGVRRPSIEYVGRLGTNKFEGCALRALDYLRV